MKPVRFHRQAEAEFTAAALHYASISPELGQRFYRSMEELIAEVCEEPTLFRVIMLSARRHFRPPFPYAIIYIDRPDHVWIIAVSPFKRRAGYWSERID